MSEKKAYGYARLWPGESESQLQYQALDISGVYQQLDQEGYDWGELLVEREPAFREGARAYRRLEDRTEGNHLCGLLRPGDVVILSSLARGWDRLADFVVSATGWAADGVGLLVAQIGWRFDTRTREGRASLFVAGLLDSFQKEVHQLWRHAWRGQGCNLGGSPSYGQRRVRRPGGRLDIVPCPEIRAVGKQIVDLAERGLTLRAIQEDLRGRGVVHPITRQPIHLKTVGSWLRQERELRQQEGEQGVAEQ